MKAVPRGRDFDVRDRAIGCARESLHNVNRKGEKGTRRQLDVHASLDLGERGRVACRERGLVSLPASPPARNTGRSSRTSSASTSRLP